LCNIVQKSRFFAQAAAAVLGRKNELVAGAWCSDERRRTLRGGFCRFFGSLLAELGEGADSARSSRTSATGEIKET